MGLKRKYPNLLVEEALQSCKSTNEEFNENVTTYFGGINNDFYKGIAKIATSFAIINGINNDSIKEVIEYISKENEIRKFVEFYYRKIKIVDYPKNSINHILLLTGNKKDRKLYCYIELFNCFKLVVLLSKDYKSESFSKKYSYNLNEEKTSDYNYIELELDYFTEIFYQQDINDYLTQYEEQIDITLKNIK